MVRALPRTYNMLIRLEARLEQWHSLLLFWATEDRRGSKMQRAREKWSKSWTCGVVVRAFCVLVPAPKSYWIKYRFSPVTRNQNPGLPFQALPLNFKVMFTLVYLHWPNESCYGGPVSTGVQWRASELPLWGKTIVIESIIYIRS